MLGKKANWGRKGIERGPGQQARRREHRPPLVAGKRERAPFWRKVAVVNGLTRGGSRQGKLKTSSPAGSLFDRGVSWGSRGPNE